MIDDPMTNAIILSASIIKKELERSKPKDLDEMIKAAMSLAKKDSCTWMLASDDHKFKAGIGAVLLLADDEDKERIEKELNFFKALGAASSGVPVNFSALINQFGDDFEPIGLRKYWEEAK